MIVIFGPHVAREVILAVPRFAPGGVHRASAAIERMGGKALNVARFCGRMGVQIRLVALADEPGRTALRHDPDLSAASLEILPSGVRGRTDVVVVDASGRATVVNGTAPGPSPQVMDGAVERLLDDIAPGDLVVLTGSLPRDVPVDLYGRLVRRIRRQGAMSVLDTSGAWLAAALPAKPDVVKVSVDELVGARGGIRRIAWSDGRLLAPEPVALVVTRGRRGSRVWVAEERWTVVPEVQHVVNPIGAGDAMLAGICGSLSLGSSVPQAVAHGSAWAAAKVRELDLTLQPAVAETLLGGVRIRRRPRLPARHSWRDAPAPPS